MIEYIKFPTIRYFNDEYETAYTIYKSQLIESESVNIGKYIQSCKDCSYIDDTLIKNKFDNILKIKKPTCPNCNSFNIILSYIVPEIPGIYHSQNTINKPGTAPLYETRKKDCNIYSDWVKYTIVFEDYNLLTDNDKQNMIKV